MTAQVAMPTVVEPARLQLVGLNVPVAFEEKVTMPDGVKDVPVSVSITVTVQLVALLLVTDAGEQLSLVDVVLFPTDMLVPPELEA